MFTQQASHLAMNGNQLAVYWDFENIHISVAKGQGITSVPYKPEKKVVDLAAIMDDLQAIGQVAVNRAYGNWQWMGAYQSELLNLSIDLIQLFPRGSHAKNGADIRLALDAFEDATRLPHLSHIVIVGGDSDFISAAQKLRELGRTVIGIGTRASTNRYWSHACNEFKFYETLATDAPPPAPKKVAPKPEQTAKREAPVTITGPETRSAAVSLLRKAMTRLLKESSDDYVLLARIRPMMTRLDSEFDPANLGYGSMREFIHANADLVRIEGGGNDKRVYLNGKNAADPTKIDPTSKSLRRHLSKLIRDALEQSGGTRLSRVKLNELIALSPPPLATIGAKRLAELLDSCPEIEVSNAFVTLRNADCGARETRTVKAGPPTLRRRLDSSLFSTLKKQGVSVFPLQQRTRILTAVCDYGSGHGFQFTGPSSELTNRLTNLWNGANPNASLSKTTINRMLNSLLRSQAFDIHNAKDGAWVWTLRTPLRNPHSLATHIEIFLIYLGIQAGYTSRPPAWSRFLYGDESRVPEVTSLRDRLLYGNYAAHFETGK